MPKVDVRKMSRKELFKLHREVLDLYDQRTPIMKIVETVGLSWPAVNRVIKAYKNGESLNEPKQPGRKKGTGRLLSTEQEGELRNILYSKRPWQVELKHSKRPIKLSLWNRGAVRELIEKQAGILLSVKGVAKYLDRWGFPSLPQHQRPFECCSSEVQSWLEKHGEFIHQQTSSEIFWIRRKRIVLDTSDSVVIDNGWPKTMTMVSAIDTHAREHWLVFKGRFTQDRQIAFLKALTAQSLGRCLCIRSNDDYFTGSSISNWLDEHSQETMVLPPTHL